MRSVLLLTFLLLPFSQFSAASDDGVPEQCGLRVTNYLGWKILRSDDLVVFTSGMAIDADGSPRAYHPDDVSGLDDLKHAGGPGHWQGLATIDGEPIVQGLNDPAPSYYVSATSLENHSVPATSPAHFVDAETVPYVALPEDLDGPELGDVAYVYNGETGRGSAAIFADESPRPGEGSIALARAIGVNADARRGGAEDNITFVVFLNSGKHAPVPREEMAERVKNLHEELGVGELIGCVGSAQQKPQGETIQGDVE